MNMGKKNHHQKILSSCIYFALKIGSYHEIIWFVFFTGNYNTYKKKIRMIIYIL